MILILTVTATRPGNLAKKVGLGEIGRVLIQPKPTSHSVLGDRAARRRCLTAPTAPAPPDPQKNPDRSGKPPGQLRTAGHAASAISSHRPRFHHRSNYDRYLDQITHNESARRLTRQRVA